MKSANCRFGAMRTIAMPFEDWRLKCSHDSIEVQLFSEDISAIFHFVYITSSKSFDFHRLFHQKPINLLDDIRPGRGHSTQIITAIF